MRKLLILLALAIPGCGGALPPKAPMDAAAISSPFNDGKPVMTSFGAPLTGRDWNCKGCY